MIQDGETRSGKTDTSGIALTVVVPTLNSAATLDWTLASLTTAGVRVIVADSYSKDNTLEICRQWNVETISVPAGNMYRAINAGLRLADTEWLAYVNSDDWVFTSSWVRMIAMARGSQADIVYGSADFVDGSGRFLFCTRPVSGAAMPRLLRAGIFALCQPSAIFRRATFEKLGGFDERYRSAADFDFFCRAAIMGLGFSRFSGQPVAAFRLHGAQISAQHPDWDRSERTAMKERLQAGSSWPGRFQFLLWRLSNIPWYAARALRAYELSGKLTLQKSTVPPVYERGSE